MPNQVSIIYFGSGVSAFTGEAFIALRWGKERGQLAEIPEREQ